MFTLCVENGTDRRYLIGFPERGIAKAPVDIDFLFDNEFGEIEDVDIVLADQPSHGEAQVPHHRTQLTSFINQPSTSEADWVKFLEKKLRVAPDHDLRLVIHIEQEGRVNLDFLSAYLNFPATKCPYSQVFAFGPTAFSPRKWFCAQIYQGLALLPELDEESAKSLVVDRARYACKKHITG